MSTWREPLDGAFLARFALVLLQAVALGFLIYVYRIENPAFLKTMALAGGGFVVHALTSARFARLVFVAASLLAVVLLLGPTGALFIVAVGTALIAICHLPLGLGTRVLILVVVGSGLAVLRVQTSHLQPWTAVWPIMASMFMFRLTSYLQTREHDPQPTDRFLTAGYFFMVPNAYYGLFPVVDFATFRSAERSGDRFRTYDEGIAWILQGILHLLVFRLVYVWMDVGELFVSSFRDLILKVASGLLMYVQVSGHFHIVVGVLHLYGFRLPRTHYLYLLPDGIADLWRRINIYWKDFMLKLVFYPAFFRLRRVGHSNAVLLSTALVLVITCVLHAYQSFWLTGATAFSWQDSIFWSALGLLMLAGMWRELPRGQAKVAAPDPGWWTMGRAVRTVPTVLVLMVLWSFWGAEQPATWLYMWTYAPVGFGSEWLWLFAPLAALFFLSGVRWEALVPMHPPNGVLPLGAVARRAALRTLAVTGLIALAMAADRLPARAALVVETMAGERFGVKQEVARLAGYYERLTFDAARRTNATWREPVPTPDWLDSLGSYRATDDFRLYALRAGVAGLAWGKPFSVNGAAMRDRDYSTMKPPQSARIALMGSSVVMGWGVGDNEPFESVAELRLDSAARARGQRVEILNFAVTAQPLAQQVVTAQVQAAAFAPDLYVVSVLPYELKLQALKLTEVLGRIEELPDSGVVRVLREAGIQPGLTEREVLARLRLHEGAWFGAVLQWARRVAEERGGSLAVLLVGDPAQAGVKTLYPVRIAARDARIELLDCTSIWGDRSLPEWVLNHDDWHPNALGHRRIAECFETELARIGMPAQGARRVP